MFYSYKFFSDEFFDNLCKEIRNIYINIFNGVENKYIINSEFKNKLKRSKLIKLFNEFQECYCTLCNKDKKNVFLAFKNNVRIEDICLGKIEPISYNELNNNIKKILLEIDDYIYKNLLNLVVFKNEFKNYYNRFSENSIESKRCPFCGLSDMPSPGERNRADFDHYLVRSKYPFVSLLRENLIPMCKECNQDYKKEIDISEKRYKKVFYPFKSLNSNCKLIYKNDIFKVENKKYNDEVQSWIDIFDVENRINNRVEKRKKGWIKSIMDSVSVLKQVTYRQAIEVEIRSAINNYYSSDNFIKKAFLEEMKNKYKIFQGDEYV